jgi:hypothetical protein
MCVFDSKPLILAHPDTANLKCHMHCRSSPSLIRCSCCMSYARQYPDSQHRLVRDRHHQNLEAFYSSHISPSNTLLTNASVKMGFTESCHTCRSDFPIVPSNEATHPTPANRESSPIFPSLTLLRSPTIGVPRASPVAPRWARRQDRWRCGQRLCEAQSTRPKDRPYGAHRYPSDLTAKIKCPYAGMWPCRPLSKTIVRY